MNPMPPRTWPEVVGYQHEVLHTGVLRHLLCDPSCNVAIANELVGRSVTYVGQVSTERKLPGSRRTPDLAVELWLGDQPGRLAVETKVDSNANRHQLEGTLVDDEDNGVLLALGITALNLETDDLGADLEAWRVVGPSHWANVLRSIKAEQDDLLAPYLQQVEREAEEHDEARRLARSQPLAHSRIEGARRRDNLLEQYAWLAEIRREQGDRAGWWTYTNRSGALMGYWSDHLQGLGGQQRDTFVEFTCSPADRRLCLKLGAGPGDLAAADDAALAAIAHLGWTTGGRRPRPDAQSCTVARLDFTGLNATDAAPRAREAVQAIIGLTNR